MTDHDAPFRSGSARLESAELPADSASSTPTAQSPMAAKTDTASRPRPPAPPDVAGGQSMRRALNGTRNASGSPSTANSPLSSRDTSPARPAQRAQSSAPAGQLPKTGLRSRTNSTDASPNRGNPGAASTVPSAASIQRALSAASIPQLQPAPSQDQSRPSRPAKVAPTTASGDTTPHWPISPRLKSPPPSERSRSRRNSLRSQQKRTDAPSIVVQSSSPAATSRIPAKDETATSDPDEQPVSMKPSPRGASGNAPKLETVQEGSLPTTPGFNGLESQGPPPSTQHSNKTPEQERNDTLSSKVTEDLSAKPTKHADNGSDNTANSKAKMQDQRSASSQRPAIPSKASYSSLTTVKSRTEAPSKNMTVETETIPSIAQTNLGNQDRSASGRVDSSLRLKPSNETIRPKKDKHKPKRKAPSVHSGTASSKADVFEQKVASAVDEANSSDSDATFIYESNPPDQPPHRSRHHHSRTPSGTSLASLVDPRTLAVREQHKNPNKKTSMKFATPYNADMDGMDRDGTIRIGSGRSGGSHHHHIGRHGQGRGALTHVLHVDSDSSMAQSSRVRGPSSRYGSQPNSPRFQSLNGNGNGVHAKHGEFSTYDIDTENAADDERTPLIPSQRSPRVRTPRRRNSGNLRHLERRHRRNGGLCRRFAGCLVLAILLLVLVFSAVGLIFATTKPLKSVAIRKIENVIATEEQLMMDLVVDAVNPNIIGVTVADMNMNIFAKSKHVGSDKWWREHEREHSDEEDWLPISKEEHTASGLDTTLHTTDDIDEGTDPIEDPDAGEQRTMLLGRITKFESTLAFDGSFFNRRVVESLGEVRLNSPGNKTETGGSERWEEVLQHPFELIVSGVFKYQLPLSTRDHTVPVTASYSYDPDAKKKFKAIDASTTDATPRRLLPKSVQILPRPWGRHARALLE